MDGIADLSAAISTALAENKQLLMLVSGGSNIGVAVTVLNNLPADQISRLQVTLVDERYGPVGHADSNWQQLLNAGLQTEQATLLPVLQSDLTLQATADVYEKLFLDAAQQANTIIGLLGIGPDGHTAGILPDTAAASDEDSIVIAYKAGTYERLTLGYKALRMIDAAYVFAFGPVKRPAIEALIDTDLPLSQQPAQILKQLTASYLYTDQVDAEEAL
jgi:6-phosphogluconolactonase